MTAFADCAAAGRVVAAPAGICGSREARGMLSVRGTGRCHGESGDLGGLTPGPIRAPSLYGEGRGFGGPEATLGHSPARAEYNGPGR